MPRSITPLACAALLAWAALLAPACSAQTQLEAADIYNHPFSADFAPGGKLKLRVRSAEVHIVGTSDNKVSVALSGRGADEARKLKVRFERHGNAGEMRICGGPHDDLTITVRIPSNTDLYARIPFGEVHVENVVNNQNVELHAGDLTVEVGDASNYSHVDASVFSGELDADPFHESKGGLFRSFKTNGSGRYRLHVHVGAGQLTLRSRARERSAGSGPIPDPITFAGAASRTPTG